MPIINVVRNAYCNPLYLAWSDTLYRMAEERHDKRMQAVAISTQLDYHYFQATNEDSIIYYTNKVKDFAKATQQPKYYYFAWSNRLILYYLKNGRTNIALYEAAKDAKRSTRGRRQNRSVPLLQHHVCRFTQSKDWIPWLSNGN